MWLIAVLDGLTKVLRPRTTHTSVFLCTCCFFCVRVFGQIALSEVAQLVMDRMSKIDLSDEFTGDPGLQSQVPPPSSALNSRSHDAGALMHTNMWRESHKLQGQCPFFAQHGYSFSFFFCFWLASPHKLGMSPLDQV